MKTKVGITERKRVPQPGGTRSTTKPLKGRRIFLHVQGYRGAAKLENDVTLLGGTVEKCFSRDVNCVVTNRGSPTDYEKKRKPSSVSSPSPVTPSPFNLATPGVDSPQGHSPGSLEVQKPLTRGKAMMQAATRSTRTYGTMDVIEMARSWKLKIIHIDSALRWIKKEIEKVPETLRNNREDASKRQMKVRKLRGPYMKFEATTRSYRPLYQEFSRLPDVGFDTAHWTCPFLKGKQSAKIDERGEGEEERDPQQGDDLLEERDASPGPSQKKDTTAKKSKDDGTDDLFGSPILTAGEIRHMLQERKRAELKRGYCEICQIKYDNIDKHTSNNRHREFVCNNKNYSALDEMITEGSNMKQFVADVVMAHNLLNDYDDDRTRAMSNDEVLLLEEPTPLPRPKPKFLSQTSDPKNKANTKEPLSTKHNTPQRKKSGHTPNKSGHRSKHSVPSPRHKAKTDKAKPSPKQTTPSKSRTQRESAANLKTPTKQAKHNRVDKVQTPKRVTRGSPQIVNETEDRGRNVPAESPVSSRASRSTGRTEPAAVEQNEQSKATRSHEVPVDAAVKPKTEHDATTSSAKLHVKSVEKGESPRRKRLTRRSLQPCTGDSPQLPESRTDSRTESQREARGKDAPESTQDSTARVLLKRLGIDATEGTPSPETKTRRTRVSSPAHKPVSANTNQSSSQRCASNETTHQSTTETGDTYLLKRLGVSEAESPMVTNRTRRHSVLSPELNPVSIKAMKDKITPRTARTIKCLLKKKGTPRVVCPRLDMDEINKSQDSLTTADSVSHATSQSDSQTNLDEGGPVRKVRSSRRSHTSSVVATLGTESKPVASSVRPKEPSVQAKSVEAVQPDASKKSGDKVCREERVDTGRQTRRRTSITVPAETNRSPNEKSQVKENRTTPRKKSLDDRTSTKCVVKREKSMERTIKKEPKVAGTSEKAMTSTPAQPSARRKVRLKKNWALVTDRSMRQILREHGDEDFEGFTKVDSNELPSDTSYEDVSEVEVGEEWEISGSSVSTVGSPAAVISTGLDCDNSSPTKSSPTKSATGLTPIKHVLGNISNIMSEASSTGWDDNLDDFLEGQLKRKTAKDDANASGLFTSLLVQVGSPRRSPRKSPLKNAKSPFKFVASPLTKTKTPGHNVPVRSSPRNHTPGQNASLRNSPKGQTPQTANRTLDFNTPNFSLLDTLGEVDDLWVGPTKNELLSRSYTQKAADRLAKTSTPGARTPIYQPQPRKATESTPTTSMSSTSKQSSVSAVASPLSSQSSVDQRKRIPFGKSPKAPRVTSPTVLSESPTSQNTKSKVTSKTTVPKSPTANSQMVTKVDEEVEFNFSSPSKRVKETLKEMIAPSPITPIENKTQPKKRLLSQMSEAEGPAKKKPISDSFDFDEPDEVEMPKKRLLKSLSNTKKKFTLSYVPSFEYKGGSSLEHNTTSSPAEPKGKSVVLANLGRSVTPRTDNGTHSSPLASKAQKPAAAAKRLARTPHKETKPMPSPSLRNNNKTTASTPQHSDKSKKRLATGDASPEPSSALSTPRTLSPGRRLDKLLALHSLEDIQFGPRRKSSNVSSIVRFHYDSEEEDAEEEAEPVNVLEQLNKSGSKAKVGGKSKDSSRGNTPKRHSLPSRSASTNLDVSSDSAKRTVSSKPHTKTKRSSPQTTTKLRRPSTGKKLKLRSPSSDKKGKSPDWSQAKPASGSRSMSRLHYTKWPKTKYTDWSKSKGHSRSKSAVELAKKRSLQSEQNNVSPGNRRNSSPRKRLRMDTSPGRASSRTRSHAAGVKTRDNGERSNLKRSVKRAVNYTEEGSPGDH